MPYASNSTPSKPESTHPPPGMCMMRDSSSARLIWSLSLGPGIGSTGWPGGTKSSSVGGNKKQALRVDGMKLVMAKVIYNIYKQYYTFFVAQVINF